VKRWKQRHWTRHSLVLVGGGFIYIGIGIAFILSPGYVGKDPSLKFALHWLSMEGWGVVYILAGFVAMMAALAPIGKKLWGYMMLTSLSSAWAAFYVLSVFYSKAPRLTLLSALIWLLLAFIWWAVSGLLSPEHVEVMIRDNADRHR
jgi:hypothetical protein